MTEAIILAGGLGTRLAGTIGQLPKCMAPVGNQPFLYYLLEYLKQQQVQRLIFSLGYQKDYVTTWLKNFDHGFSVEFAIEEEPLGTGGGIALALSRARQPDVVVLNGDTIFLANLPSLMSFHKRKKAATSLALREMKCFDRYGTVQTEADGRIIRFEEKKFCEQGLINGGCYVINKDYFFSKNLPRKCSFEKDFLEHFVDEGVFFGSISSEYFIDIGIPLDYQKAQTELPAVLVGL